MTEQWTHEKPTQPGAYWVRGNGLDENALVEVKVYEGALWCNLHMVNTEPDIKWGYTIAQLSPTFEWLGPLYAAPVVSGIPSIRYDGLYEYAQINALDYNELCGLVRSALNPPAVVATAEQKAEPVDREAFEALLLGMEHPIFGWLDINAFADGDTLGTYADEYVQGAWIVYDLLKRAQPVVADVVQVPSVEALAEALNRVKCFHDMSAELIAPTLRENLIAAARAADHKEHGLNMVQAEPAADLVQVPDIATGVNLCIAYLENRASEYAAEHGSYDYDTGCTEFRNHLSEDYYNGLHELADELRALLATSQEVK